MHSKLGPSLKGETTLFPLPNILLMLAKSQASGVLHLEPSGLRFYMRDGLLEAVEGDSPIGQILNEIHNIRVNPTPVPQAGKIGQTWLESGEVDPVNLKTALTHQAKMGLRKALDIDPQRFVFLDSEPLPAPVAGISILEALVEAVQSNQT